MKKLYRNFEEYACISLLSIMIMCLVTQVVARALFGTSFAFTEELSRYTFIWTIFIGGAMMAKHSAHVKITAHLRLLPMKARLALLMVTDTLWILINFLLVWASYDSLLIALEFPEISPTLFIVKAYVEMVIPACFLLINFRIIEKYIIKYKENDLFSLVNYEEAV